MQDPNDSTCKKHKIDMYNLVNKCLDMKQKSNEKEMIPACKEILSAYCYVFSSQDIRTCMLNDHDIYVPGKKSYSTTTPSATGRTIKINVITNSPVTTTRTIKINVITNGPVTTSRPTTTTTSTKTSKSPFEKIPGFTGTVSAVKINCKNKRFEF